MGNHRVDSYWIEEGKRSRAFRPLLRLPVSRWRPKHFKAIADTKNKWEAAFQDVISDEKAAESVFGRSRAEHTKAVKQAQQQAAAHFLEKAEKQGIGSLFLDAVTVRS